jgi:hypothetical protein
MLDFYTIYVTALTLIIKVSSFIYVINDTHITHTLNEFNEMKLSSNVIK